MMWADQCFNKLLDYEFKTVLDIGCGKTAPHANLFLDHDKLVTGIDIAKSVCTRKGFTAVRRNFMDWQSDAQFDCVWASHVLEHQLDVQRFLRKVHGHLKEGGVLAITVPPATFSVVGGHLSLWTGGLLLYRLILANFDCAHARLGSYEYNISVIVEKKSIELPPLCWDKGDIEALAEFFPFKPLHGFNGLLGDTNWKGR